MALRMRSDAGPDCLISGGEPTVRLVAEPLRGKGGRNQQLALAALLELGDCRHIALLSAGTDGEDGPTNAAGAIVTEEVCRVAREQQLARLNFSHVTTRTDSSIMPAACLSPVRRTPTCATYGSWPCAGRDEI